jgi:putative membrane protein
MFIFIYTLITPYNEIEEIRAGNKAAALALGGALIGFALPLSAAIRYGSNLFDSAVWATISLLIQLFIYFCCNLIMRDLHKCLLERDEAKGVFVATISIAFGIIAHSAMSVPS